jgi:phosphate-selective porin OprO/OprP
MRLSLKQGAAVVVWALSFLVMSATAEEEGKVAGPAAAPSVQEQLEQQQLRIAELERLLKQQALVLEQMQQQLASKEAEPSPAPNSASAAVPAVQGPTGEQELGQLSGEVDALAQTLTQTRVDFEKLAQAQEEQKKNSSLIAGWTGSHPYIRSSDGNFYMQFGGRMQLDYRSYSGEVTPSSSFFMRRARLEAEGHLFKNYEYKVQADFADTGSTLLRDGYLNINYLKPFQVQFGQFKAPFSQEELQSSKYIDFVERSSVNNVVPGRSPGLMLHGNVAGGFFEYYAAAMNGRGELAATTASTPEFFGRLRFTPLKTSAHTFSFGGAVSQGRNEGGSSFRGRTASRSVSFFSPVPVNGKLQRFNGEFWWTYKNFSIRGEYDQTNQFREGLAAGGGDLPGVAGKGYLFQATYLLTGEKKGTGAITPKRAFLADKGGLGAWELAIRYENLQMDDHVNPNRAEAYTFGVNWWLSKFVRYQSNVVWERIKDTSRAPNPGNREHIGYLSRVQVIF